MLARREAKHQTCTVYVVFPFHYIFCAVERGSSGEDVSVVLVLVVVVEQVLVLDEFELVYLGDTVKRLGEPGQYGSKTPRGAVTHMCMLRPLLFASVVLTFTSRKGPSSQSGAAVCGLGLRAEGPSRRTSVPPARTLPGRPFRFPLRAQTAHGRAGIPSEQHCMHWLQGGC